MLTNGVHYRGRLLRLAAGDNVAVTTADFPAGAAVPCDGGEITLIDAVPMGHKVAVAPIATGAKIVKYGCPIGSAVRAIAVGERVHIHNLQSDYLPTRRAGKCIRHTPCAVGTLPTRPGTMLVWFGVRRAGAGRNMLARNYRKPPPTKRPVPACPYVQVCVLAPEGQLRIAQRFIAGSQ